MVAQLLTLLFRSGYYGRLSGFIINAGPAQRQLSHLKNQGFSKVIIETEFLGSRAKKLGFQACLEIGAARRIVQDLVYTRQRRRQQRLGPAQIQRTVCRPSRRVRWSELQF